MREEEYLHLVRRLDEFLEAFERTAPLETQEQVGNLLAGVDLLHREGLRRLVEGLRRDGAAAALLDRLAADDRIVAILLGLYDLGELPVPPEAAAETGLGGGPAAVPDEDPGRGRTAPGATTIVPLDTLRRSARTSSGSEEER